MRTSGKILVGLALLVVALLVAKRAIVRAVISGSIEHATGFTVEVRDIKAGLFQQYVEIQGLKLRNPSDFPERDAFDIERLYVKYDLMSFLTATVRVKRIDLDISQVVMVKKSDGESNLERMRQSTSKQKDEATDAGEAELPTPPPGEPSDETATDAHEGKGLHIDVLTLKLGKAEIRDYARGSDGKPKIKTYDVNVDRTFKDLDGVRAVANRVASQVLLEGSLNLVNEQLKNVKIDEEKLNANMEKISQGIGNFLKQMKGSSE